MPLRFSLIYRSPDSGSRYCYPLKASTESSTPLGSISQPPTTNSRKAFSIIGGHEYMPTLRLLGKLRPAGRLNRTPALHLGKTHSKLSHLPLESHQPYPTSPEKSGWHHCCAINPAPGGSRAESLQPSRSRRIGPRF